MNSDERAAYRAFVRANHPDHGGDPDVFVAGLARFREGGVSPDASLDDPRWDGPVEIVTPLPAPLRVAVALIRTLRRHRNRRVL